MSHEEKIAVKEKILEAACNVFVEKGKAGARMQEIADVAGVNKAMLFYYYTNKDLLYKEVLRQNVFTMITNIKNIMISEDEAEKKIENFVDIYTSFFQNNPQVAKLLLRELASDGHDLKQVISEIRHELVPFLPGKFIELINNSIRNKQFNDVDPQQTIISIIGLSLVSFITRPILEAVLGLQNINEDAFIAKRKENILTILKHGLLARENK